MPGQPALDEIAAEFGADVLQPDGHLDRKRLGAIVFSDPERRKRLEQITHPAIYVRQQRVLSVYEEEAFEGVVLWDAAVLIESSGAKRIKVVVVSAIRDGHARPERDGMSDEEARGRTRRRCRQDKRSCRLRDLTTRARRDRAPGARRYAAPRRPEDGARRRR
jgi:dephospho-CoA kinase